MTAKKKTTPKKATKPVPPAAPSPTPEPEVIQHKGLAFLEGGYEAVPLSAADVYEWIQRGDGAHILYKNGQVCDQREREWPSV